MTLLKVNEIGHVEVDQNGFRLVIKPVYRAALLELEKFEHIQVLWWFNQCDNEHSRNVLVVDSPYQNAPKMGTFATRSPERPNPIALTCSQIAYIDHNKGEIGLYYIDAQHGSPIIDIKPYTPSFDRLEKVGKLPTWCANWPKSIEEAEEFDWHSVFTFQDQ